MPDFKPEPYGVRRQAPRNWAEMRQIAKPYVAPAPFFGPPVPHCRLGEFGCYGRAKEIGGLCKLHAYHPPVEWDAETTVATERIMAERYAEAERPYGVPWDDEYDPTRVSPGERWAHPEIDGTYERRQPERSL